RMGLGNNKLLLLGAGIGACLAVRALVRQQRQMNLRGRTVLITGGSRGLGLVMARELIGGGANLAICARDTDELERARLDLVGRGGTVLAVPCDVTVQEQVESMVRTIQDHYGYLDVLINNAGVIEVGPLEVMTPADFQEAMQTNFWGPLHATLAVLP